MPRTYPPRRTLVAFRIAPAGLAEVDVVAAAEFAGDRSKALRALVGEALAARAARPRARRRAS